MRPGLINNTAIARQNDPWFHQTQLTFRRTVISDANRLVGTSSGQRAAHSVDQGGIWDPSDPDKAGGPMANSRKQEVTSRRFALNHTYNFSPTVLNIASFTFGRYRNPSFSVAAKDNWPSTLGFGETGAGNFPVIEFAGRSMGLRQPASASIGPTITLETHLSETNR
jgi:hypothetical protein